MEANGSDIVTVVAAVADENGNIKRLNNYFVRFEIEGEGTILGDEDIMANPRPVQWGTAPVLVKSTTRPGKIKVRASVLVEGTQMPASETIEIETFPSISPSANIYTSACFLLRDKALSCIKSYASLNVITGDGILFSLFSFLRGDYGCFPAAEVFVLYVSGAT